MSRELETGADGALQAGHVSQVVFAEFDFASGASRVCTREHSVDWNSQTWLGAGRVGAIEPIAEGGELEARGLAMTLSGLPSGLLALALTPSEYKGREVRLWFGQLQEPRYVALPGSSGNFPSSPDAPVLDITGDLDVRWFGALDNWAGTNFQALFAKDDFATREWALYIYDSSNTGCLGFARRIGGSYEFANSSVATGFAAGTWRAVRWTHRVSDGRVQFSTSADEGLTWSLLGSDQSVPAGAGQLTAQGLQIGMLGAGTIPAAGKARWAEIRNGIDGPVVARFDAGLMNPGQTSAQMSTGEVWTINQSGSPAARIVREPLTVVADPVGPFIFKMDQLSWQLGGESCALRMTAESRLADWQRPRVRRYNNADHQALHPGDKFFEHVERQIEAVHRW